MRNTNFCSRHLNNVFLCRFDRLLTVDWLHSWIESNLPLIHSLHWLRSSHHMARRPNLWHWMSMTKWRIRWHSKLWAGKTVRWCKMGWECWTRTAWSTEWRCIRWRSKRTTCIWSIVLLRSSWIGWRRKTSTAHILRCRWTRRWRTGWRRRCCILRCIRTSRWSTLELHRLPAASRTSLASIREHGHRSTKWIWAALWKSTGTIALIIGHIAAWTGFPSGTCVI